jgi:hypothetical protein
MSTSTIKKISAAAVAAVLGFSSFASAQNVVTPIYSDTTFNNANYTNVDGSGGSIAGGALSLPGTGSTANPTFYDFSPNTGTNIGALTPGHDIEVTWTVNTNIKNAGSPVTSTTGKPLAGVSVLDGNGNFLINADIQYGADGLPDLLINDAATGGVLTPIPYFAGGADGTPTTYTLTLDPYNNTWFVATDGTNIASNALYAGAPYAGGLDISGVALEGIDQGISGSAQYSSFSVTSSVPEPASIGMIGLGGLLLLAKRPKRLA